MRKESGKIVSLFMLTMLIVALLPLNVFAATKMAPPTNVQWVKSKLYSGDDTGAYQWEVCCEFMSTEGITYSVCIYEDNTAITTREYLGFGDLIGVNVGEWIHQRDNYENHTYKAVIYAKSSDADHEDSDSVTAVLDNSLLSIYDEGFERTGFDTIKTWTSDLNGGTFKDNEGVGVMTSTFPADGITSSWILQDLTEEGSVIPPEGKKFAGVEINGAVYRVGDMITLTFDDDIYYKWLWIDEGQELPLGETLVEQDGKMLYYKGGVHDPDKFGFVNYNGGRYLVANGVLVANKNGLTNDPDNKRDWYFLANGKIQEQKSGLVQYPSGTKNWFYVQNGKLDTTYNGKVSYNGGDFFVARGKILTDKNGLFQDPNNKSDWYFLANGQVQSKKTGIASYNKAGFYVVNGKLNSAYTGTVTDKGKTYNVVKGRVV